VVDALEVRGWSVTLHTGPSAHAALRRSLRNDGDGLRVLCVFEGITVSTQTQLRDALDPHRRGDLLVIPLETPRQVIDAIERFSGTVVPRRGRPNRTTRSYLAHPTLIEAQLDVRRWSRYGIAGTLATTAVLIALTASFGVKRAAQRSTQRDGVAASPPVYVEPEHRTPGGSLLIDKVVLSAAAASEPPEIVRVDTSVDDRQASARPAHVEAVPDAAPTASPPRPRFTTVDPFATPEREGALESPADYYEDVGAPARGPSDG
jgi:hypothetical protein